MASLSDMDPQPTCPALCVGTIVCFSSRLENSPGPAIPNNEVGGSQQWRKRHRQNTSVCPRSAREARGIRNLLPSCGVKAKPTCFQRGRGRKGKSCSFLSTETHPVGAGNVLVGPLQGAGWLLNQEVGGSLLGWAWVPLSWEDFACFCPEPRAPMHSSVGQRAGFSLPSRAQVKVQGLGLGRNRDKGGERWRGRPYTWRELNDAGLSTGDTQGGRTGVCV